MNIKSAVSASKKLAVFMSLALTWAQAPSDTIVTPFLDYLPKPEVTQPLQGLLPRGGMQQHPSWGYLKFPERNLVNVHEVDFESREVRIHANYLNTVSKDTNNLWTAYYQELATYTFDMYDIGLKRIWLNSLIGQKDGGQETAEGSLFDISIPVNMPAWMKDMGLDKPKLQLQGQMDIKLLGKGTYDDAPGSLQKSLFPSPSLNYQPSFLVKGKIGRNITVEVNNTESGLGVRNQLRIIYAEATPGEFEDFILQRLELGSTSLSLKGTELTGYSENHQGLFGVKADFKVGDWAITTIASQDAGSAERYTLRANEEESEMRIRDKDFVSYRYYFLDHRWRNQAISLAVAQNRSSESGPPPELKLFKRSPLNNEKDVLTNMTAVYLDADGKVYPNKTNLRLVEMKMGTEWEWDRKTGTVKILVGGKGVLVAASWPGDVSGRESPVVRNGQSVTLIQDDNSGSNLPGIGKLMLRNVYQVGISESNATGFVLRMKDQNQKAMATALRVLGVVDTVTGAVRSNDADIFPKKGNTYTGEMWLPCLPTSWYTSKGMSPTEASKRAEANCFEPLRNVDSSAVMAQIYDLPVHNLSQYTSRYYFETVGKKRQTNINVRDPNSSFSVSSGNCIDIAPGSEKLKIGSDVLKKDVDYSVNYELGSIELISDRALNPNNEITVTYECEPLFEIENKILLGARAEYPLKGFSSNSLIGLTALYKSQSTTQQQPRYGGEPFSSVLFGANLRLQDSAAWMDRFINFLPFIDTKTKSSWSVEGELAASYHDANSSDRKAALLEDFEGSSRSLQYSMYRTYWTQASPPGGTVDDPSTYIPELDYRYRGEFIWHSNQFERYRNVYAEVNNTEIDSRELPILKFTLRPNDNLEGKSWGGVMRGNSQYWQDLAGMNMRYLEVVARGNVGSVFVELGALSEDLSINGYAPNGELNSEARDGTSTAINDFGLDGIDGSTQTETRLDWDCRVPGCVSKEVLASGSNTDAARDNFDEQQDDTDPTLQINGTEGNNGNDERLFDTEDLDNNWSLDTEIRYVRYRVNLESSDRTQYDELKNGWRRWRIPLDQFDTIVSGTGGSWNEILSDVRATRLWYGKLKSGVSEGQVQIVDVRVVGNQWQEKNSTNEYGIITSGPSQVIEVDGTSFDVVAPGQTVRADSNYLHVRVINNRDDSRTYFKSPNTVTERDAETSAALKEQSLVLDFGGLNPGQQVWATKIFEGDDKDLTQYQRMLMEIHFMSDMDSVPVRFALQFGQGGLESSNHYYEWSFRPRKLSCGAQEREQDCHERNWLENAFDLPLADFVALKAGYSPLNPAEPRRPTGAKAIERDEWVRLVGNPTISRINWIRFVVIADDNALSNQIRGRFWVNDLRLSGIRADWGLAGRLRGQLDFADVMSISGEMHYQDGDFATLKSEGRSPKPTLAESNTQLTLNGNYSLMLHKFFKDDWGLRIPLSIGVSTSIRRPYLKPSSDQSLSRDGLADIMPDLLTGELDAADSVKMEELRAGAVPESQGYQSVVRTKTMSIGFSKEHKKGGPWYEDWLTQALLARPSLNYRYSESESRSALRADSTYTYNTILDYKLGTFDPFAFKPFDGLQKKTWVPSQIATARFEPWPQTLDLTLLDLTYSKNINQELDADFVTPQVPRILDYNVTLRHKANMRWNLFPFLTASYNLGVTRDMDGGGDRESFTKENLLSSEQGGLFASGVIFDYDHTDRAIYGSHDRDSVVAIVENYSKRLPKLDANGDTILMVPGDTNTYVAFYDTTYLFRIDSLGTREYGKAYGILRNERDRTQDFKLNFTPALLPFLPMRISYGSNFQQVKSIPDNFNFYDPNMRTKNFWSIQQTNRFEFNPTLRLPELFGLGSKNAVTRFLDKLKWKELRSTWAVDLGTRGEDFTLAQLYQDQGVDPSQYWLYGFGLGDGFRHRSFWNTVSGDMGLDSREDYERFAQYRSKTVDTSVYRSSFSHTVARRATGGTNFSLPFWDIGVTTDVQWSEEFKQLRETPLYLDTVTTWPKVGMGLSVPNFANRFEFLQKHFRSMSASHRTDYTFVRSVRAAQSSEDEWKETWAFSPLIRISALTPKNIRIDNDITLTLDHSLRRPKVQVVPTPGWPGSGADTLDAFIKVPWVHTDSNETWSVRVGDELSVAYDLKTKRGFQLFKWYFRLKNDINLKLNTGMSYEEVGFRERPILTGYLPLQRNDVAGDVIEWIPSRCGEVSANCYAVYGPIFGEAVSQVPTRKYEFHIMPSAGYQFNKMATGNAFIEYQYVREKMNDGGTHNVQTLRFEIALMLRFE